METQQPNPYPAQSAPLLGSQPQTHAQPHPQPQVQQVVVMGEPPLNSHLPMYEITAKRPTIVKCPNCSRVGETRVAKKRTAMTLITYAASCAFLYCCGPCILYMFYDDEVQQTDHFCQGCNQQIAFAKP